KENAGSLRLSACEVSLIAFIAAERRNVWSGMIRCPFGANPGGGPFFCRSHCRAERKHGPLPGRQEAGTGRRRRIYLRRRRASRHRLARLAAGQAKILPSGVACGPTGLAVSV